jgi:gamma-glutamyl-gamma-aminobutyrate hydrolase PuuD
LLAAALLLAVLAASLVAVFLIWTRSGSGVRVGLSVSDDWYDRMQIHRAPYDLAIKRAGGAVVTIEPQEPESLERLLDGVDGLVLAGGGDVDPELTGGDPSEAALVDRRRDDFEMALLERAEARGLPVLAICRGIQVLAVAEGGTLRHLSSTPELADRHGVTLHSFEAHEVWVRPGTRLHSLLGAGPHTVNSFHQKAVKDPGPRLEVAAVDEDGVIEAVELPGERLVVGVQWHPELHAVVDELHMALFRLLLREAERRRQSRGR